MIATAARREGQASLQAILANETSRCGFQLFTDLYHGHTRLYPVANVFASLKTVVFHLSNFTKLNIKFL